MKFGVHLPTYWDGYGDSNALKAVVETAKAAEALGYAAVWANDSVVTSPQSPVKGQLMEPMITLASLIHVAPRIGLGMAVLVLPQRNAFVVAKQVSALDLLSGGRFILGIGSGWRKDEFKLLGADFASRAAITDEAILVLRRLWSEPVASFEGQFHSFSDALMLPKPASGGPPIWIGGNGQAAIRRAASFGSAWIPFGIGLNEFRAGVVKLRELSKDRSVPMMGAEMIIRIDKVGKSMVPQKLGETLSTHIAGNPEGIVQVLDEYRRAGLEYLICVFEADNNMANLLEQMGVFAEKIAPHFADNL